MFTHFRNKDPEIRALGVGYNVQKIDALLQEIIDRCEEHNSGHAECDLRYEVEDSIRRFLTKGGKYQNE